MFPNINISEDITILFYSEVYLDVDIFILFVSSKKHPGKIFHIWIDVEDLSVTQMDCSENQVCLGWYNPTKRHFKKLSIKLIKKWIERTFQETLNQNQVATIQG